MHGEPVIPAPLDGDDDDVAWALQTAAVQWQRGARADAVLWLRRAVEAAISAGNPERTRDLTRLAANVADRLVMEALAAPDSIAPPSGGSREDQDVDALLRDSVPAPPRPQFRQSAHSLTSEIPFEFDDGEDDDFDDDAPTIPPPSTGGASDSSVPPPRASAVSVEPDDEEQTEEELDVNPDEIFSARPERHSGSVSPDAIFGSSPLPPEDLRHVSDANTVATESEDDRFPFADPEGSSALDTEDEPFGARVSAPVSHRDEPRPPSDMDHLAEPESASPEMDWVAPSPPMDAFSEPSVHAEPEAEVIPSPTLLVDGVALDQVRGFEDLPEPSQYRLSASAVLTSLAAEEEVSSFGAALVTRGKVGIMPAIADVAASTAAAGDVVFTGGTLEEAVSVRVVALEDGTVVASWSAEELAASMSDCPWVADELKGVGDRFQALAGATLGPLGDRLDDSLRGMVFSRLDVKSFAPGETIVPAGKVVPGLHVVGAGRVEFVSGEAVTDEASPGDFLFAAEVLGAGKAKAMARAGPSGALVLFASRSVAHELLMSVPPLVEILAG